MKLIEETVCYEKEIQLLQRLMPRRSADSHAGCYVTTDKNNPLNNFKPEVMTVCSILVQNRFGQQRLGLRLSCGLLLNERMN